MDNHHGRKIRRLAVIGAIFLLLCTGTPVAWSQKVTFSGKRGIDVATVNLYVGADFTPVLLLNPADPNFGAQLVSGVATIYGRIRQSNIHARANALARQIVDRDPDLVALQEVSLLRRQSPGDAIVGGVTPATAIDLDYLAILLEALKRQGGHYEVVSAIQNTDVELPLITGPGTFDDIRLTDRDVILARTDLPPGHLRTFNPQAANFAARLPSPIGLTVLRGWCSIDVQIRGRQLRLINTHLEDGLPPPLPNIQLAQASELLGGPARTALPIILTGDFNSDAYGNYSPETYSLLINQGALRDVWTDIGGRSPGLTWGHDQFLADLTVPFMLRLDLILYRGPDLEPKGAEVVDPAIGTAPPFWFSDHGGLFASIAIN